MNYAKLLVTALIGAVVGVCVGYAIYVMGLKEYAYTFTVWLADPDIGRPADAILWAAIGTGLALGLSFILRR